MLPHAYPLYHLPPSDMLSEIPLHDLASTVLLTLHMVCCHGPWVDFGVSVSLLLVIVSDGDCEEVHDAHSEAYERHFGMCNGQWGQNAG